MCTRHTVTASFLSTHFPSRWPSPTTQLPKPYTLNPNTSCWQSVTCQHEVLHGARPCNPPPQRPSEHGITCASATCLCPNIRLFIEKTDAREAEASSTRTLSIPHHVHSAHLHGRAHTLTGRCLRPPRVLGGAKRMGRGEQKRSSEVTGPAHCAVARTPPI